MSEYSNTYMARGAEQSTIEEIGKERTVEGETKEYATNSVSNSQLAMSFSFYS